MQFSWSPQQNKWVVTMRPVSTELTFLYLFLYRTSLSISWTDILFQEFPYLFFFDELPVQIVKSDPFFSVAVFS